MIEASPEFFADLKNASFYWIAGTDTRYENNLRAHLMEEHHFARSRIYKVDIYEEHDNLHLNNEYKMFGAAAGHHHYFRDRDKEWDNSTHGEARWLT